MKYAKSLLMVVAALAGMVFVTDLSLQAQSLALSVTIPFEFHAGEAKLPAGTYIVQRRGEAILISDGKGNAAAVLANAIQNKAYKVTDLVVFHRYGDERFLSEVRWSEYSAARGLMESKAERRMANLLPAETVKLAAATR